MRIFKNYFAGKDGIAAVEFALVAPILAFLIAGVLDYGLYLNTLLRLENTARAAAQYVLEGGDPEDIQANIIQPSNLSDSDMTSLQVEADYECGCGDDEMVLPSCDNSCFEDEYKRRYFEVNLSVEHKTLFPYPGLPATMPLRSYVRLQVD